MNNILFILSYLKTLVLGLKGEKKIPERQHICLAIITINPND